MRKVCLFTSILLLVATMAVAQQSNPSSTAITSQDQSAMSAQNTIQGCLNGTESNFTVTDQKSGITYKLSGSNDPLKEHVGHMIQLTGTPSSDTSNGSTFKFDSVKMISSDCSAGSASATQPSDTGVASQTTASSTSSTSAMSQPAQPSSALPQSEQPATTASTSTPPASATTTPPADTTAQTTTQTTTTETQAAPAASAAPATTITDNTPANGEKLPQTASPLPLLGLLGFGSLLSGFWARFKK